MTDKDKPSLHSLYQQRRTEHRLPEQVKARLHQKAKQKRTLARWKPVLPTVAASLLVVVILWPMQNTQNTQPESLMQAPAKTEQSQNDFMLAEEAPIVSQEMAVEESIAYDTVQTEDVARTAPATEALGDSVAKTLVMAPAPQSRQAIEEPTSAPTSDSKLRLKESKETTVQILTFEDFKQPVFLYIEDAQTELVSNCAGDMFTLEIDRELPEKTWMQVQWHEGDWNLKLLGDNPCN